MLGALRALFVGGLGLAASFLVACGGGSSLLTSTDAGKLNSDLAQIQSAVDTGQCSQAASAINAFNNDISSLPGNLNQALRSYLSSGASNLTDIVGSTCHVQSTPTTTTTTKTATTATTAPPTTSTHTSPPTVTRSTPATTPTRTGTTSTGSSGGVGIGGSGSSGGAGPGSGSQGP